MDLSRRGFMIVGTTSLLSLDGGLQRQVGSQQAGNDYQFQGVADLLGPRESRPEPGDGFFENKIAFAYRYEVESTGERFFITDGDDDWARLVGPTRWDMSVELAKSELGGGIGTIFAEPSNGQWKIRQVSDDGNLLREGTVAWTETALEGTVDDFEDVDIAEYTGDTTLFVVDNTSPVPHGSYSLKTDAGTSTALIISTSGLDNYLDQGETMAVQLHPVTGNHSRMGVPFFVQDASNFYMVSMGVDLNDFQIFKNVGGSYTLLVKADVSLSQGTEYRVEISPQADGTLAAELFDESAGTKLASISTTDTDYTDGGNGWRIASGSNGSTGDAYDFARLV